MSLLTNFCVTFDHFFIQSKKLLFEGGSSGLAVLDKTGKLNIKIDQSQLTSTNLNQPWNRNRNAFLQNRTTSTFRGQYFNLEKPKFEQTRIISSELTENLTENQFCIKIKEMSQENKAHVFRRSFGFFGNCHLLSIYSRRWQSSKWQSLKIFPNLKLFSDITFYEVSRLKIMF